MYRLTKTIRVGVDDDGNNWSEIRDNGDFRRTVDFKVDGPKGVSKAGAIFQFIQKNTNATVKADNGKDLELETSEDIAEYTGDNVKFMCDSYLEYFVVDADGTTFGDQFGNGAICKYTEEGAPILDRRKNISKGTITQNGTSIFVPAGPGLDTLKKGYNKIKWNKDASLPANGLPYFAYDEAFWNSILKAGKSNVLTQSVTITWSYKAAAHGVCVSCDPNIPKGGSRKTRKAH